MTLLILIGLLSAMSELSNHGKLNHWPQWFTQDSWMNKNTWRPTPLFTFWPLIIFADAFHFFKTLWLICFCLTVQYIALEWYWCFIAYSVSFQCFYWLIPLIKVK